MDCHSFGRHRYVKNTKERFQTSRSVGGQCPGENSGKLRRHVFIGPALDVATSQKIAWCVLLAVQPRRNKSVYTNGWMQFITAVLIVIAPENLVPKKRNEQKHGDDRRVNFTGRWRALAAIHGNMRSRRRNNLRQCLSKLHHLLALVRCSDGLGAPRNTTVHVKSPKTTAGQSFVFNV